MNALRRWLSLATVAIMFGGGILGTVAQEATPGPMPEAPNAGEPLPGQYAFYPSEVAQPGGDLPGDPAVQLVLISDQLEEPVNVAAPKDGTGRIFVVERGGKIKIVQPDGTVLPEPFLNWTGWTMSAFLEQGLLGLAFHPNYAQNGVFYINYTDVLRSGDVLTLQFRVSADDPNVADAKSAEVISFRSQPYPNHIGGDIEFGPDGCLYIGHGDGGLEGDPLDAGQDFSTHLGKMLRIDVNPNLGLPACGKGWTPPTADEAEAAAAAAPMTPQTHSVNGAGTGREMIGKGYSIPADNPFVQGDMILDLFGLTEDDFARYHPYAQPEIWAYGIRNPWQFSFDRETGDLWIGDAEGITLVFLYRQIDSIYVCNGILTKLLDDGNEKCGILISS